MKEKKEQEKGKFKKSYYKKQGIYTIGFSSRMRIKN